MAGVGGCYGGSVGVTQKMSSSGEYASIDQVVAAVAQYWQPPPDLAVAQWAEQYRYLSPEASAEAGKWTNARAPHLVGIMDALSPSDPCQEVTLKASSQTGKTEVILNFIAYIIDQDPGPILAIQPNQKPMGEAFSKDRITPMVRDTPQLRNKIAVAKGRDAANTLFHKTFPGGHLTIGGANSPAGLASRPIRYLLCDELDRWEITKEGHALPLAVKRTRTFYNRKILKVSSPTYDDEGIDAEYKNSEQQFELHMTCPDCGESQFPQFKHFQFDKTNLNDARYVCEHCGVAHSFEHEDRIKLSSHWVKVKDEGDFSKGFWMNQWASPFAAWMETIKEFLNAKDDPEKLRVVVNTAFAEGWKEIGEEANLDSLLTRREEYALEVPDGVEVLTLGADVQADRIEAEIVGWNRAEESWSIDYQVMYGDPTQDDVWHQMAALLQEHYQGTKGRFQVSAACIDSGFLPKRVYEFVLSLGRPNVWATKGVAGQTRPIIEPRTKRNMRLRNKKGAKPELIGVDEAKSIFYRRINGVTEPGPGFCHFPAHYDQEYFEQLTAEKVVTRMKSGWPVREWRKMRQRNEALDCRVGAYAALKLLNPKAWTQPVSGGVRKKQRGRRG